jgi:hypothetical protein
MRSVWHRFDALATDGDTGSASSTRVFTLLISALKRLTFRPAQRLCADARCGCTCGRLSIAPSWPARLGQRRGYGGDGCQHDGVGRRWDDWHRGWPERVNAARKVRWCVSPIDVLPTSCPPFPVTVFFLLASISSTRQTRRSSRRRSHISLAWRASSHSPTASRGIPPLSTTPSRSKNHPRVQWSPRVHWLTQPYYVARNRACLCAMLNAAWPALLAALFLLTTNLSESIFGDV